MDGSIETDLSDGLTPRAVEFLEGRGLDPEIAARMGVTTFGGRIVFEYRRGDRLLWVQHRIQKADGSKSFATYAPDHKTSLKDAGVELSFWNEDSLLDESLPEEPRVITEGQFDAVAVAMTGASFVGSVPNGARDRAGEGDIDPAEDNGYRYLWRRDGRGLWRPVGGLATARKIILCTDGDKSGLVLRDELALRLGRTRCWFVTYPEGCKDANEVLLRYGVDALRRMLDRAEPLVPPRLVPFSRIPVSNRTQYEVGWGSNQRGFDRHFRIVPPQLIVVTGKPNAGKSQWTLALVCNLARIHNMKGALLQFEDNPERNREDLVSYATAYNLGRRPPRRDENGDEIPDNESQRVAATRWIDRMFVTIAPSEAAEDEEDYDLEWLKEAVKEAATIHGCRWVVIDPWNEVEHMWSRQDTEATYLNRAIRQLKRLSRLYSIVLIIVTHPTKAGAQMEDVETVTLNEISGGAAWNNKADLGVIVWADDVGSIRRTIKVSKSKDFARMGRPGMVRMDLSPTNSIYSLEQVQVYDTTLKDMVWRTYDPDARDEDER